MRKVVNFLAERCLQPMTFFVAALVLLALVGAPAAQALPQFLEKMPAGYAQECATCHVQPPVLNDLGKAFQDNGFSFDGLNKPAAGTTKDSSAPAAGHEMGAGQTATPTGEGAAAQEQVQEAKVELILPATAKRGEKMLLKARVTSGGTPVQGQKVAFFEETDLFRQGRMNLGQAATDANGMAAIEYWPRAVKGKASLAANLAGNGQPGAEAKGELALSMAGPLVESPTGLRVPFMGSWLVVLLVLAVWGVYCYVLYSAWQIRKLGRVSAEEEIFGEEEEQRYASS